MCDYKYIKRVVAVGKSIRDDDEDDNKSQHEIKVNFVYLITKHFNGDRHVYVVPFHIQVYRTKVERAFRDMYICTHQQVAQRARAKRRNKYKKERKQKCPLDNLCGVGDSVYLWNKQSVESNCT